MSQNGKLMPNLDQHHQSTKVLNLTVLQRLDPFVEEILTTAAHVTVYEMKSDLSQWRRKDVEGSLFVVKRNTQPRFQFIVMNRLSTDNLVEDLLGDFEYEVQVPYLLYRNAAQVVNGIWFYNQHESEAVANLFSRILNAYSKVPPKSKVSTSKSSEFEELEAVPSLSVIEGPLEPASSSAAPLPDVPDEAFVNFFSAAMNGGTEPNAPNAGQLQSSTIPLTSNTTGFISSPLQTLLTTPSMPIPTPISLLESHELISSTSNHANLVKPSLFSPPSSAGLMMPPVSSLKATAHPLHPPLTMQQPYGTPLLQPFPPPAPSPSLTPAPNYGPVITRDKVRDALLRLVQNNNFIDMVYREMLNAHYS